MDLLYNSYFTDIPNVLQHVTYENGSAFLYEEGSN
jgi:hypothetical protein